MHVLITTQVFPPEIPPTAVMARELAAGLARRGWRVTVAAGLPHHPTGAVAEGYAGRLRAVEEVDGYRVIRTWHPTTTRRQIPLRAAVMALQSAAIAFSALSAGPVDAVISFGGPPLLGPFLSGIIAKLRGAPMLTVIHDLYPDVAIENGALRNPIAVAATRWLERLQFRLSRRVVVLGETTKRTVEATGAVAPEAVSVVPVWLDPDEISPGPRDNGWRRSMGIRPDQFLVLYAGTSGLISGAEILERVATELPGDVVIALVGGGSAWKNLARLEAERRLPANLRLIPYQPRELLPEVQSASDLSLLTLLPGRGRTSVPSKLQGYMAAGRPVLVSADDDCDTAHVVRREGIGRVVAPGDPRAISSAIRELRDRPEELAACGARAREAFVRGYAREPVIGRYAALLAEMVEGARSR